MASNFLSRVNDTQQRYEQRSDHRARTSRIVAERGILHADEPRRVTQRLARLGCDWTLATALERTSPAPSTGRSLGPALAPENFGADLLGLERLMGRNDLVDVGFLEAGYLAARSIGRIVVSGPGAHYGTGFMVSPTLLLTNNHVLADGEQAARSVVEFNFQAGIDGRALTPVTFALAPDTLFLTDRALDFTLVAVSERNPDGAARAGFGWLPLLSAQGKVVLGELVNIIQHPNGEPKQLALRENRVVDLLDDFVHYHTDTAPGSSGSPVFNDQWEVVGLHHSGVPATDDDGHYLSTDGTPWTPEMGEHRLAWEANEGVRVSRIVEAIQQQPLTGPATELRAQLFESVPSPGTLRDTTPGRPSELAPTPTPGPDRQPTSPVPVADAVNDAALRWTLPLQITVSLDAAPTPVPAAPPAAVPPRTPPAPQPPAATPTWASRPPAPPAEDDLRAALVNLEANASRPYYEAEPDQHAQEEFYRDIDPTVDGAALRAALAELLEATHVRRPAYKPMRLVYPWVDLHPDRELRSIYSGTVFSPESLIRADADVEAARTDQWQELLRHESSLGPEALLAELTTLEAALPFNCEHVVPQSWFAKREPMRGDLHHLFACESGCNSFRGNFPYFDFTDREEATRHACGRRETDGFEPTAGKGPVARATLYFMLRYPTLIGDAEGEFPLERLPTLLTWHETDPVGEYERHRNAAITEIQGNRNPLIDHPDWAARIDFDGD